MDTQTFLNLSNKEITDLLNKDKPAVCACPINGTRRWYALEHQDEQLNSHNYLKIVLAKYVEIFHLLFSHGLRTVLTPIFGPELLTRGDEYAEMAIQGMKAMVTAPVFMDFIRTEQVQVRFYGDYVRFFQGTRHASLLDLFAQLTHQTRHHHQFHLFFGVCGHDASEQVAQFGAQYSQQHGRYPSRQEIVTNYYGVYVESLSLFIGFDKFSAFDVPLLMTGNEDLYFMTAPTPYLSALQLRLILFDHLFARRQETDYPDLTLEGWKFMRHFYQTNRDKTIGVGTIRDGIWYPLPQVEFNP